MAADNKDAKNGDQQADPAVNEVNKADGKTIDSEKTEGHTIEGDAVEKTESSTSGASGSSAPKASSATAATREIEVEVIKKHGHGGLWFFTLINFLIVIALIAGAYWVWVNMLNVEKDNPQIELLEQRYSTLQNTLSGLEQSLNSTNSVITTQEQQLEQLQSADSQVQQDLAALTQDVELNSMTSEGLNKRLADVAGRRPSDWLLAEADYLVKLAGKKLYLEDDVQSAIMLLKSADVRIADLSDSSLLPVRALIAKDIQQLQQVNEVASTSIALSLSALIAQVDDLPLDTMKLPDPVEEVEQSVVSEDVSNWRANLKASWDAIVKDFISVNERTTAVTPFMSEKQQWLAREQLKFALLNAQQAVLQGESALYQQSLTTALNTVVTHYQLENTGVEAYMASINDLINIDTQRSIPTQLDSQQPLAEVIEARIQTLFAGGQ